MTTPITPVAYVISNATLRIGAYDVAGTPGGIPYAGAWNGSLWSLYYEFLCYVVVALLGSIALFRRSAWAMTGAFAVAVAAHAGMSWLLPYTQSHVDVVYMAKLLPFFLGGGILFMVRDRLPLTWPLALVATVVTLVAGATLSWVPQLCGIRSPTSSCGSAPCCPARRSSSDTTSRTGCTSTPSPCSRCSPSRVPIGGTSRSMTWSHSPARFRSRSRAGS